jgi:hypothetical protein
MDVVNSIAKGGKRVNASVKVQSNKQDRVSWQQLRAVLAACNIPAGHVRVPGADFEAWLSVNLLY